MVIFHSYVKLPEATPLECLRRGESDARVRRDQGRMTKAYHYYGHGIAVVVKFRESSQSIFLMHKASENIVKISKVC